MVMEDVRIDSRMKSTIIDLVHPLLGFLDGGADVHLQLKVMGDDDAQEQKDSAEWTRESVTGVGGPGFFLKSTSISTVEKPLVVQVIR